MRGKVYSRGIVPHPVGAAPDQTVPVETERWQWQRTSPLGRLQVHGDPLEYCTPSPWPGRLQGPHRAGRAAAGAGGQGRRGRGGRRRLDSAHHRRLRRTLAVGHYAPGQWGRCQQDDLPGQVWPDLISLLSTQCSHWEIIGCEFWPDKAQEGQFCELFC